MNFEIVIWAFIFSDYDYFKWFGERTRGNLIRVIKWKRLRRAKPTPENIDALWNENNHDIDENETERRPFSIVTRAFLFHLKWPIEYPILDSNTFKAMRILDENYNYQRHANITNWEQDYMRGYRQFFQEFYQDHQEEINNIEIPHINGVNKEIIKRKILDRALWAYGRS